MYSFATSLKVTALACSAIRADLRALRSVTGPILFQTEIPSYYYSNNIKDEIR
jgi:hypothetical protein